MRRSPQGPPNITTPSPSLSWPVSASGTPGGHVKPPTGRQVGGGCKQGGWSPSPGGGEPRPSDAAASPTSQIFPDGQYFHLRHRGVVQQSLTPHWGHRLRLKKDPKVQWFEQQTLRRRVKRSLAVPTDPWFSKQWYMNKEVQPDLNILQVWSQGLTGQGVVVSVLDDGIEKDHPDLWANYDPLASYDFNDYDPDPQPRYTPSDENRHGTRCAGEVAAIVNNGFCGAGVAFNARIGGVRMLDGTITDVIEAQSLSLQPQHIHIYSASWGPEDDGRTVDGPGILTREAFRRGVTKGRGGLGTLFIWASGNGGLHYDNCNCDGYTNSIHTLSVGSTTQQGRVPWYSEACASTLTTTYSSGVATDPQIACHSLPSGHHGPASPVHGQAHRHLSLSPAGCGHHCPGSGGQPVPDMEGHAAPCGSRIQACAAAGRGLENQWRGASSEPPLRLWAAGRRAAGGHGSHLGAHVAPEEMHCQRPAQPHPHPAAHACGEQRVSLRWQPQLHPLAGARAGAAVAVLQPPRGPGDLPHQPHGHPLHPRGHQVCARVQQPHTWQGSVSAVFLGPPHREGATCILDSRGSLCRSDPPRPCHGVRHTLWLCGSSRPCWQSRLSPLPTCLSQAPGHQPPRLQQLDLHVHPLLG
ncbi:proprotein convertase subtilisin/kexin type 4 isoform X5 [Eulemur rufifrons]|uniref:proprotein convertase subtilisin/kexin type 4 isoform X5 n=1 Tax=Eulemur rufifrons TaxID=859984 RepID=UPI003742CABC